MFEYILIVALIVSIIAFFKWLHERSKIKKIIVVDECVVCPFMKSVNGVTGYYYQCSAMDKNMAFKTPKDMNELCEFGGKIEIKISEK